MQPLILGHAAGTPLLGATWRPGGYRPRSPARALLGRDLGRREAREVTDLVPVVRGGIAAQTSAEGGSAITWMGRVFLLCPGAVLTDHPRQSRTPGPHMTRAAEDEQPLTEAHHPAATRAGNPHTSKGHHHE